LPPNLEELRGALDRVPKERRVEWLESALREGPKLAQQPPPSRSLRRAQERQQRRRR